MLNEDFLFLDVGDVFECVVVMDVDDVKLEDVDVDVVEIDGSGDYDDLLMYLRENLLDVVGWERCARLALVMMILSV